MNKYLAKHMGTSFVGENVRGGSGAKAMAKLATAPADGSIFYGTTPTFINTRFLVWRNTPTRTLPRGVTSFPNPRMFSCPPAVPSQALDEWGGKAKAHPARVRSGTGKPWGGEGGGRGGRYRG